jgi:hypothetical protein
MPKNIKFEFLKDKSTGAFKEKDLPKILRHILRNNLKNRIFVQSFARFEWKVLQPFSIFGLK